MQITPNADVASIFVASARERPLPDNVLLAARMCLVDWFGVAIAARDEGAAQVVLKVAAEMTHDGGGRILFGRNADAATAALVNGTMAHCLDFDDTHVGSLAHLSGPIWAATLAVGTAIDATPCDMLKAFVTGFEIGARIGRGGFGEALNTRSIHSTGICGCLGAAAAASALYGLDAERAKNALGAAATQAAGLTGSFGTMSKPFHAGKAAFNGVLSAQLARSGFVAAGNLIEEWDGIAAALIQDRTATIAPITFAKGDWEILRNTFKPYASCLLTHAVIDCGSKLHAQIGNRGVESIVVDVHPMAVQLAGKPEPRTPLEGKFSTAYCAALALSGHSVAATDFSVERLGDPKLRDLTGRTKLNVAPGMPKTAASMSVILDDGATLKADTPLALGNPDNPMSWNDMEKKFLGLTGPIIGQSSRTTFNSLKRFAATRDLDAVFAALRSHECAAGE